MFSKKPETLARPVAGNRTMGGSTFSVLGADTTIKGDVAASADLHIDGKVEGDIACSALVQGESSEIVGAVSAETARLAGTVRGSIRARELVILRSARIHGDVHYDALTIEQGAQVDGRFAPRGPAADSVGTVEPGDGHLTLASSNT
jgi:cytoskeletal protein CcmA (bactofilin family)